MTSPVDGPARSSPGDQRPGRTGPVTSDVAALKDLVPISSLAPEHFQELAASIRFEKLRAREVLFKYGSTDNDTIYVLAGEVQLIPPDSREGHIIAGGTEQARYPLAQLKPRQFTGKAKTDVTLVRVASDQLDQLLTWDQVTEEYEVTELAEDEDAHWVMQVLRNPVFRMLPATNFNELFKRLQPVHTTTNEAIIRQGEPGDYFYLVKEGRCCISRKAAETGKLVILSEPGAGDSFGEEALLAGVPRNATVTMKTDGLLMRLSKQDFDELLRQPLIRWVGPKEAKSMLRDGAGLVDVRLEEEYEQGALKGSINVPLYLLRLRVTALDRSRSYILCCETGNRSAAAAFLLSERGFDVYVLQGGLAALRALHASRA